MPDHRDPTLDKEQISRSVQPDLTGSRHAGGSAAPGAPGAIPPWSPLLATRANAPVRQAVFLQAQQTYGNRALQRVLQRAPAGAQGGGALRGISADIAGPAVIGGNAAVGAVLAAKGPVLVGGAVNAGAVATIKGGARIGGGVTTAGLASLREATVAGNLLAGAIKVAGTVWARTIIIHAGPRKDAPGAAPVQRAPAGGPLTGDSLSVSGGARIGGNTLIGGSAQAGGALTLGNRTVVGGGLQAGGGALIRGPAEIGGSLMAAGAARVNGKVHIPHDLIVTGPIRAGGFEAGVIILMRPGGGRAPHADAQHVQRAPADGQALAGSSAQIGGSATIGGGALLAGSTTIGGQLSTGGVAAVRGDVEIGSGVQAGSVAKFNQEANLAGNLVSGALSCGSLEVDGVLIITDPAAARAPLKAAQVIEQ